jgi:hypothetical protein
VVFDIEPERQFGVFNMAPASRKSLRAMSPTNASALPDQGEKTSKNIFVPIVCVESLFREINHPIPFSPKKFAPL